MAVYKALGDYLKKNAGTRIPMTFKEVEAVIDRKLPASAFRHRPWWANEERGHSHAKAWLAAGYETEHVDMAARKLVFRRASQAKQPKGMMESTRMFTHTAEKPFGHHPAFGAMKGTFSIEPGYDLTSPMYSDQEWAEIEKEMDADWDTIEQGFSRPKK
jgi:hypothetical protein